MSTKERIRNLVDRKIGGGWGYLVSKKRGGVIINLLKGGSVTSKIIIWKERDNICLQSKMGKTTQLARFEKEEALQTEETTQIVQLSRKGGRGTYLGFSRKR